MSAVPNDFAKDQPAGFSNRIERVAVVVVSKFELKGADVYLPKTMISVGGQMGRHIAGNLLATGKQAVAVITRPNSDNKMPEVVRVVRVNYCSDAEEDVAALVEALRGQQVLLVTMTHQSLSATTSLVHAAAKANVPYILPNWYGHDAKNEKLIKESLMTSLLYNAKLVESLGVSSYFLLVCDFWYKFSLGGGPHRYGFDFRDRSLTLYNNGEVAINTSTWPQCGRAIAQLLSLKELPEDEKDTSPTLSQFRNECIYISSVLPQRRMTTGRFRTRTQKSATRRVWRC